MREKELVGQFDEIKDLSEAEQIQLLEEARYFSFVTEKRAGRYTVRLLILTLALFVSLMSLVVYFDSPWWATPVIVGACVLCVVMVEKRYYQSVIRDGLVHVLSTQKSTRTASAAAI